MDTSHDFLGEEVAGNRPVRARIVKVPIELSTSYLQGTALAPDAITDASRQIELYNCAVDVDLEGAGIITLDPGAVSKDALISFLEKEREELKSAFHCFIGGEHSITPWILGAMGYGEIGIVWIDAHADLRPEYMGDSESHACAARNSLQYGDMVELGVRSFSSGERDFINKEQGVSVHAAWDDEARRSLERLPKNVYISLDFDGVDPTVIRAVGTPEPGGLSWPDLMDILDTVFSSKRVIGMDAVELCPSETDETSNFIAAKAVYEAVSRALAGEVGSE